MFVVTLYPWVNVFFNACIERLAEYHDKGFLFSKFGGHFEDTKAALEYFKASQLRVYDHEFYLEEQTLISRNFLERKFSEHPAMADRLSKNLLQEVIFTWFSHRTLKTTFKGSTFLFQVVDALKNPVYSRLERLESRKFIERCNLAEFRVLKSSLRYPPKIYSFCSQIIWLWYF